MPGTENSVRVLVWVPNRAYVSGQSGIVSVSIKPNSFSRICIYETEFVQKLSF